MSNAEVEFSILAGSGAPIRAFKQGEVVFREGDPATELYVVKSGRVDISSGNRLLATLEENGIFGEMALIDKAPRSAQSDARSRRPVARRQQGGLIPKRSGLAPTWSPA